MIRALRVLIRLSVLTPLTPTPTTPLTPIMPLVWLMVLLVVGNVNAQNTNTNTYNINTQSLNTDNANAQNVASQNVNIQNPNTQNTHTQNLNVYGINTQNPNPNVRLLNIAGEPIKLTLVVGQEVQLNFDNHLVSLGTPIAIKDKIKTQMIDTRLWLKAIKAFKPVRLLVRDERGELRVFLLSANVSEQKVQPYPLKYTLITEAKPPNQPNSLGNHPNTQQSNQQHPNIKPRLSYIDLTRFVAQTLYAPKRLIEKINLIRLPINTQKAVRLFTCSSALACNGNVLAHPIASWRATSYFYVSAVVLKNTTKQVIVLDPRDLLGKWQAATFQFNRLGRANSPEDSSVVYLISAMPFEQSL